MKALSFACFLANVAVLPTCDSLRSRATESKASKTPKRFEYSTKSKSSKTSEKSTRSRTSKTSKSSESTAGSNDLAAPEDAICLNQADFERGTVIISSPGTYKLCEDISFGPRGPAPGGMPDEDAFDPVLDGPYGANEFGLGFFSAVCVASSDVTIHLNNFTIEQSAGHALMQRFFSVFELASSPFIPGAGPAQFVGDGGTFVSASNISILGPGVIGRSAHHGVHGNNNTNVKISGVEFRDFEVAAVSINNADSLEISDCRIAGNRRDVPVVGMFGAARFIRPYGKYLKERGYEMFLYDADSGRSRLTSAAGVYDRLIASINNVYEDVVLGDGYIDEAKHPEEHHLFDNPFRVVDGPCYAVLVHGKGPAIGGQGERFNETHPSMTSRNVVIRDNVINGIKCWNNEVPAMLGRCGDRSCVVNDVRGSVVQTVKTFGRDPRLAMDADGTYRGNVVSDMQIMVASAILDGVLPSVPSRQTGPNSVGRDVVEWARGGTVLRPRYVCNGDTMHHVIKGIIAIRVEDTAGFRIARNTVTNIENMSVEPFTHCDNYHIGASSENRNETQSGNVRAISVAAVRGFDPGNRLDPGNRFDPGNRNSQVKGNTIGAASSARANVIIGIDVQGDSKDVDIRRNAVNLHDDREERSDKFVAVRVREAVDDSVTLKSNRLAQRAQVLNSDGGRARARALRRLHARVDDVEWKLGGCPFASDYARK